MDEVITTIGSKIKELREAKHISEEEMANRAGLDVAFYRLLEQNREVPTIGDLIKVVRVLGVRLGTLLDDQQDGGPVVSRVEERKHEQVIRSKNSENSEIAYYSLSQRKGNRHMESYSLEIQPASGEKHFSGHEGEEFLYVLEGEVEICYGKETYLLKKGDSIYYDSIVPHYIGSASATNAAKLLAVIYIPV